MFPGAFTNTGNDATKKRSASTYFSFASADIFREVSRRGVMSVAASVTMMKAVFVYSHLLLLPCFSITRCRLRQNSQTF